MASLTYLITGANRGIGRGFTTALLQRPNTTVVAAVRDVAKSTPVLDALPKAAGSKLVIVKIDSSVDSDPKTAVSELQSKHGITSLDVVIANAGIGHTGRRIAEISTEVFREHLNVNTIGPVLLFQATRPLLQASKSGRPVFLAISTALGSIASQEAFAAFPLPTGVYGSSKAALNLLIKRLNIEEPWLVAYVTHPGLVKTDLASFIDNPDIPAEAIAGALTVEESVKGVLSTVDKATKEIGGTFQNVDGTTLPW
ncbi:aflatoxin biosynthesis ketoreductase nor-1 [Paraphoma chrysanthemicola]|nr:aflatoxin biosynthesis ketoreductase nor-1 [Paraphoma chrysanthemicola]